MEVIRQLGQFALVLNNNKKYQIINSILTMYTENEGESREFDEETKRFFMSMDRNDFIQHAIQRAGNNIYSQEVRSNYWDAMKHHLVNGKLDADVITPFGDVLNEGMETEDVMVWFEKYFGIIQPDGNVIPYGFKRCIG